MSIYLGASSAITAEVKMSLRKLPSDFCGVIICLSPDYFR